MIKRLAIGLAIGLMMFGSASRFAVATDDVELGTTSEVIKLLKSRYVDHDKLDDKLLNDATVVGIIQMIGAGAIIVTPGAETNATPAAEVTIEHLARAEVIDPAIGYIRVADVVEKTIPAVDAEVTKFTDAKVIGYVLDLRYADGHDYEAAATLASRFLNDGQELFTLKSSDAEPKVFHAGGSPGAKLTDVPLMVLINDRTRGSAEALAGALRSQNRAILIGNHTAGAAVAWEDLKLSDDRVLRVATSKILFPGPDGTATDIFPGGLKADIPVKIEVKIEDDLIFNVQTNMTLTASLQPRQKKKGMSEAELVKAFHGEAVENKKTEGENPEEGEIQAVRDVVLQRAVDILKGIRVLLSLQ